MSQFPKGKDRIRNPIFLALTDEIRMNSANIHLWKKFSGMESEWIMQDDLREQHFLDFLFLSNYIL